MKTQGERKELRDEAMKYITLLKANGMSNGQIAEGLGTTVMSLYRWRNNISAPYPASVKLLKVLCEERDLQWVG
jgi:DNA-binding transcriptional regulator YiaG